MIRTHRGFVFASMLPWIAFTASAASASDSAVRVEIPIAQTHLSNGDIRFSVPVTIGDTVSINAMLDTGSFGLRVMGRALAPENYKDIGVVRDYSFGSGVVLHGPLAKATLRIGDVTIGTPIILQVVQSVGCTKEQPRCPATKVRPEEYGIGGDGLPREGFEAILGLSMRAPQTPQAAISPLAFVGDQVWMVVLPLPNETIPGKLIVNPEPRELQGFERIQVPRRLIRNNNGTLDLIDDELPGSFVGNESPMKMDSGDPDGLQPFYHYSILFDLKRLTIGAKPRGDLILQYKPEPKQGLRHD